MDRVGERVIRFQWTARLAGLLVVALIAAGCGPNGSTQTLPLGDTGSRARATSRPAASPPTKSRRVVSSRTSASEAAGRAGGGATSNRKTPGPRPIHLPWKLEVPVSGSVRPTCVLRGSAIVLSVHTKPGAAIGYQAVYSDNGPGAPPPMGDGYGGNDKGFAASDGSFTSSWAVSPKAPPGPARVDVIVGFRGKWGYAGVKFAVADPSGTC